MNTIPKMLILGLFLIGLSACAPKVSSVDDSRCYEIEGDNVIYTCDNTKRSESVNSTPGYDGPNNPKALNLYRPGRFESINSPVW